MPRNTYVRRVSGCALAALPSREPRLVARRALSSSYIHFGISGSCAGSVDHTHFTGSLTFPCRDRDARRLNTWNPVYLGFFKIS
ncbi:MAG TPA: hypothetical protein VGO16_17050 [Pseudonocardiaceae bacterium]|nr:hypothetical protein [Pseudonocardiaceae bacterium]